MPPEGATPAPACPGRVAGIVLGSRPRRPLRDVAVLAASFLGLVTFDALRHGRTTRERRPSAEG